MKAFIMNICSCIIKGLMRNMVYHYFYLIYYIIKRTIYRFWNYARAYYKCSASYYFIAIIKYTVTLLYDFVFMVAQGLIFCYGTEARLFLKRYNDSLVIIISAHEAVCVRYKCYSQRIYGECRILLPYMILDFFEAASGRPPKWYFDIYNGGRILFTKDNRNAWCKCTDTLPSIVIYYATIAADVAYSPCINIDMKAAAILPWENIYIII